MMLLSFRLILADPTLRLIALMMLMFGAVNASLFPYQSLIAITRLGFGEGQYALVLLMASVVAVTAAVGAGIVTDQRANRRQVALVTGAAGVLGPVLMLAAPGALTLVLCHGLLIPVSGSLYGQCFALAQLACAGRPGQRDAILAGLRALLSLAFLIALVLWSLAFGRGLDVMAVYPFAALCGGVLLALTWAFWPRDGRTRWRDAPSGLNLRQSLREMARTPVLLRLCLLGSVTAASALYMVLVSLVFADAPARGPADVALFVGLVAGFEVPFMLLMPRLLRRVSRVRLIGAGGLLYALYLALMPLLAPTPAIWLLPVLAGLAGAAILVLPIAYLQDLLVDRPGAAASLLAVQKVMADSICAAVFATGSHLGGHEGAALLGALIATAGAIGLMLADRRRYRALAT